jgi:hypothetical protein
VVAQFEEVASEPAQWAKLNVAKLHHVFTYRFTVPLDTRPHQALRMMLNFPKSGIAQSVACQLEPTKKIHRF